MKVINIMGLVVSVIGIYLFSGFDVLMPIQKTGIVLFCLGLVISSIKK